MGRKRTQPTNTGDDHKPKPPTSLTAQEKKHWEKTADHLAKIGLLSTTDVDAVEVYVRAWGKVQRYEAFLAKNGDSYQLENGFLQPRNEQAMLYKNLDIVRRYQLEFGLTPNARSKIGVQLKKTGGTWGDFFTSGETTA